MQLYIYTVCVFFPGGVCFSLNVNEVGLTFATMPPSTRRARTLAVRAAVSAEFRRLCSDS